MINDSSSDLKYYADFFQLNRKLKIFGEPVMMENFWLKSKSMQVLNGGFVKLGVFT